MPVHKVGQKQFNALDLHVLQECFRWLKRFPGVECGLENPTTRPGEAPEHSFRFGRQVGNLEAFLVASALPYKLIAPSRWKMQLNLPGKQHDPRSEAAAAYWEREYPDYAGIIRGPRGGLLDGRLDALLIAHWMRIYSLDGIRAIKEQHGVKSQQVRQILLRKGPKTPKFLLSPLQPSELL